MCTAFYGNRVIRNSGLTVQTRLIPSMETAYRVVWKPRYKKLGISTNHIIPTAF